MTTALAEPPVTFAGDRMAVRFDRFDPAAYRTFLRCKALPESEVEFDAAAEAYTITAPARYAELLGVARPAFRPPVPYPDFLFDDQRELIDQALEAKRFALWCKCGWGKTLAGLEFARQVWHRTGGRVLIVTLNEVVPEWAGEAKRFYGKSRRVRNRIRLHRLYSRSEMRDWCKAGEPGIGVVNYEKFNPDESGQVVHECRHLAGVVLDEASRLKASGGKQKWALIKSFKGVEFKLCLTATPAPNDIMEYASQASFLETMRSETEILWTYFTRDQKTQKWTVKPHARKAFYEFMAGWSVYVNDPKRYGWRAGQPDVPPPEYVTHEIEPTDEQREAARVAAADQATGQMDLFGSGTISAIQRMKLSQMAKGFRYVKADGKRAVERIPSYKPTAVARIVAAERDRGAQVIVWTEFDAESAILSTLLTQAQVSHETLTGSVPAVGRGAMIKRFRSGTCRVLLTRAKLLGYGMNLQQCTAMVFSGWSDSFEALFQAIHRAVRHGQAERVRVHFPMIRELEGDTFDNLMRKMGVHVRSVAEMEERYIEARKRLNGVQA